MSPGSMSLGKLENTDNNQEKGSIYIYLLSIVGDKATSNAKRRKMKERREEYYGMKHKIYKSS